MKSKSHRISIPSILESRENSLDKLGYLLEREDYCYIMVFFDEFIKDFLGDRINSILKEINIKYDTAIITSNDFNYVADKAFNIPKDIDAIVGIGGGKVLDAAKYMGFLIKKPFISVPTSTSNDGFSSPVASLLIDGKRSTVKAKVPYGIVVDTSIIKGAPNQYIYSGLGDLVSNITALWDWSFEEKKGYSRVDDFAVMISKNSVDRFMRLPFRSIKDEEFIQNLVDSLIMNGIAMEISGSSAPSSGSEHLISHALDKILTKPYLHGIQVGIATYLISIIQDNETKQIDNLFISTGFWEYARSLKIKREDFINAIDLAPSIKPHRHTIIHIEENRKKIKDLLLNDSTLNNILV